MTYVFDFCINWHIHWMPMAICISNIQQLKKRIEKKNGSSHFCYFGWRTTELARKHKRQQNIEWEQKKKQNKFRGKMAKQIFIRENAVFPTHRWKCVCVKSKRKKNWKWNSVKKFIYTFIARNHLQLSYTYFHWISKKKNVFFWIFFFFICCWWLLFSSFHNVCIHIAMPCHSAKTTHITFQMKRNNKNTAHKSTSVHFGNFPFIFQFVCWCWCSFWSISFIASSSVMYLEKFHIVFFLFCCLLCSRVYYVYLAMLLLLLSSISICIQIPAPDFILGKQRREKKTNHC